MDFTAPLKGEILRPVMTHLVPGATLVAPCALFVRHRGPEIFALVASQPVVAVTVLTLAMLAAGFVLEDVGTRVEVRWDESLSSERKDHRDIWNQYLLLAFKEEPIGQRYLRTVLLRMKFELHFAIGLLLSWPVWLWLQIDRPYWSGWGFAMYSLITFALAGYLIYEARTSARVLGDVRRELVNHYLKT
jgi:hypothetical protein